MAESAGLPIRKPVSLLNRAVKVNFKDLFKSIGKAAVDIVSGNYVKVIPHGLDALFSIGLEKRKPEEIGWMLIFAGLVRSLHTLTDEHVDLLKKQPDDLETFCAQLDSVLENAEVEIPPDFFKKPGEIQFLDNVKKVFKEFLKGFGLTAAEAKGIADRLPAYFVFALHEEWRERFNVYEPLLKAFDTPFAAAAERMGKWRRYSAWLQLQAEERVFLEAFSLSKVYIPPRAYWEEKKHDDRKDRSTGAAERKIKHVLDLTTELEEWFDRADKEDALRVICGDPGCGKSSFAKIFAARIANRDTVPVLFVPLHRYDVERDLRSGLRTFVSHDGDLPQDPLDPGKGDPRLLVIFDGLDELAQQGKTGRELVEDFLVILRQDLPNFNNRKTRLQILVTGRELVVRANDRYFRSQGQVLQFLPYYLPREKGQENYGGTKSLLKVDQRKEWWQKYGLAKGKQFRGIPKALDIKDLREITAQPLLNYLLALSYDRKRIDFSSETNLNRIYDDLIEAIYERVWERHQRPSGGKFQKDSPWPSGRQHPALESGMDKEEFKRVLQEIAVSAWHNESRSTTVSEVRDRCNQASLDKCVALMESTEDSGILKLFTAFYFRQSEGRRSGDPTFEFVHKSFGEYLVARRIVRLVAQIHKCIDQRAADPEEGWSQKDALVWWAKLCGPAAIDFYVLSFLAREVVLFRDDAEKWQETFARLIEYLLRRGNPIEELRLPTYVTETTYARNAEEGLLVAMTTCAMVTEKVRDVDWPSATAFGTWISKLRGQRGHSPLPVTTHLMGCLDLRRQVLCFQDLRKFFFLGANFSDAYLLEANLSDSILTSANLSRADLSRANLSRANLSKAYLAHANLTGAILAEADVSNADLSSADLSDAKLAGANLSGANLSDANLWDADLSDANLEGAKLDGANLTGTILDPATREHV
jgi:hypothetical protein